MRKYLKVFIIAMLLLSLVPVTRASAATTSGNMSALGAQYTNITWMYDDETQTQTLSGDGAMPDFTYNYNLKNIIGYKSIKHLIISEGITSIGNYAMYTNSDLLDINIANTVKTIGNYAFDECTNLQTITGMQGVEDIGDRAFFGVSKLAMLLSLPNVKTIGAYAFNGVKVTGLNATELTTVGSYSFSNVTTLTSVNAPSLSSIGANAFEGDTALSSVSIASNSTIAVRAFKNTPVHATYPGKSTFGIGLTNANDVIAEYNDYTQIIRIYGTGAMRNFTYNSGLVNNLTLDNVQKLVVEDGVTNIGDFLLYEVVSIPEVHLANSVETIGRCAFSEMEATAPKGLLTVTGMQGVISIGDYAFDGSGNITSIDALPKSLTTIGQGAFQYTNHLNGLVNNAEEPQTISSSSFYGMGGSISENERVVSANSTNTTFVASIQNLTLNHQIIYLDAIPDPSDFTLEDWVDNENTFDSWFVDSNNNIGTYISQGGTAVQWYYWGTYYSSYTLGSYAGSSGWSVGGGSSSQWSNTGGTISSYIAGGGSGDDWAQAGGDEESWIAGGGNSESFNYNFSGATILLDAEPTIFSITGPSVVSLVVLSDTTVIVSSDLEFTNSSPSGPILIKSITFDGIGAWKLESYDTDFKKIKVNDSKLSFSLNGNKVDKETGEVPLLGELASAIMPQETLNLDFEFKLGTFRNSLSNENIGQLNIVFDWDSI